LPAEAAVKAKPGKRMTLRQLAPFIDKSSNKCSLCSANHA
jgi:hypothetical protein